MAPKGVDHSSNRWHIALLILFGLILTPTAGLLGSTPRFQEILTYFEFSADQARDLMAGKVISNSLVETSDKELAIVVAMLVRATPDHVVNAVLTEKTLEVNRDVLEVQELTELPLDPNDLAGLDLTDSEHEEASKLMHASAGSVYNLNIAEIDRLNAAAGFDPDSRVAANMAYRLILADRASAYMKGGVRAILPYDRGRGKRASPDKELTKAAAAERLLADKHPDFYNAFVDFPQNDNGSIIHRFYGFKQRVEGRPCIILAHRLFDQDSHIAIIAERQFYVGHTYNSLQIVAGCVPVKCGTIVFYTNRTSTDQVAGFGSSLKHSIGRSRMRNEVIQHFQIIRKLIAAQ